MKPYKLFPLLVIICIACKKNSNGGEDPLCSKRAENNSNQLKLNGFYYLQTESSEYLYIYILNQNGTLGRTTIPGPLSSAEAYLNSSSFLNAIEDSKSYWGVYHVSGSSIDIDTWHANSNGRNFGFRWSGNILSDTSFIVTNNARCDGSDFEIYNKTYYFYPTSSKPDSVTSLIP